MKRFRWLSAAAALAVLGFAGKAEAAPPSHYTADKAVKINVMGEWAHPDDDTSIIGPCGVWHQRYGIRCGIITVTRGEGGGNAVGSEIGPALGLRRENEDRIAHYRSGTVDIFNLDRVDFFYNQSAPLTQTFWSHDETLRRVVRIIRMTQPDIYVGFTPTLGAGHGNHQQAGRFIWEGMKAAADPNMFPDQLPWPARAEHLAGQEGLLRRHHGRHGRHEQRARLHHRLHPGRHEPRHGRRRLDGLRLAVPAGRPGNIAGQPAGSPKSWEQVHVEGQSAYPTQSRMMRQDAVAPTCPRFGMTYSRVPFQPNVNPDGSVNPLAGRDDAILFGATRRDPGGFPLGTQEYLTFDRFYNAPGTAFTATLHVDVGPRHAPGRQRDAQRAVRLDGRQPRPSRSARSPRTASRPSPSRSRRPRTRR